jgi:hypothetical protein
LSLPTSVVITGMESTRDLDQAIEAVRTFHPLKPQELATLLDKTRDASQKGEFEQFKTTTQYDGTVQNPQWLG